MTPHDEQRTDLLKQELARLDQEYRARCKPIFDELIHIANCYPPPMPIVLLQGGDIDKQMLQRITSINRNSHFGKGTPNND